MKKEHKSLNEILVKLFNEILKNEEKYLCRGEFSDLTITEMHIIENIGIDKERTMSATAKDLKITSGTLTIAIDNLIKKGYVIRRRSEKDRRVVMIKLTDKGDRAYEAHDEFHKDMVVSTLQDLDDNEEIVLIKALVNVAKYFRKKYDS